MIRQSEEWHFYKQYEEKGPTIRRTKLPVRASEKIGATWALKLVMVGFYRT